MTITELVRMAKRIHDAEGWHLGASSTRDRRNAFWERVVGCAYWGHPVYNSTPDPQWHCKDPDGPGGRPQSDDVAVSMPSRNAWDCIPGAGADGYRFEADHEPFILPADQFVFVPAKPNAPSVTPTPPVEPPKPPVPAYPGDGPGLLMAAPLFADYAEKSEAPNPGMGVWLWRCAWDMANKGLTAEQAVAKHRAEWRAALGLPPL